MEPRDVQCLWHIQGYCSEILDSIQRFGGSYEDYLNDRDYQKSVSFSILQIGELCKHISQEFRTGAGRNIPWKSIIGMRNLVVHDYGHVEKQPVWDTMMDGIPSLLKFCQEQLDSPEAREILAELEQG